MALQHRRTPARSAPENSLCRRSRIFSRRLLRSEPPEGSLRNSRKDCGIGQQLPGDRRIRGPRGGNFLYDPFHHRLLPVVAGDLRPLAIGRGQAEAGAEAPLRLIYVADVEKLVHASGYQQPGLRDPDVQRSYYYVDTGLIAANVYLFAASVGLASWFHNCDKSELSTKFNLRKDQRVLFGQTIGYPMKRQLSNQVQSNLLR